jgi:alkylation response protein AidB-like acyl-CoA dehydrogenase
MQKTREEKADELRMLTDFVTRFAADHTPENGLPQTDLDLWSQIAEMGLIGLALPEASGGAELGAEGLAAVAQALGSVALPVDFACGAALAANLLCEAQKSNQDVAPLLEAFLTGEVRLGIAGQLVTAAQGIKSSNLPELTGNGLALKKLQVFGAREPEKLLCLVQQGGGVALCLVSPEKAQFRQLSMIDGRMMSEITADIAPADIQVLLSGADAQQRTETCVADVLIAVAADSLGAMDNLYRQTLDYMRMRKQFGKALGSFQTIQFRLVDMSVALDEAKALVEAAAEAQDNGAADARALTLAAWVQTLWSARHIAQEAVQLHGGIGMTEECAISPLVKRLLVNEHSFGQAEAYMSAYRQLAA